MAGGAGLVKPDMLRDGAAPPDLPAVLSVDLAISEKDGANWTAWFRESESR